MAINVDYDFGEKEKSHKLSSNPIEICEPDFYNSLPDDNL